MPFVLYSRYDEFEDRAPETEVLLVTDDVTFAKSVKQWWCHPDGSPGDPTQPIPADAVWREVVAQSFVPGEQP
jgi:hypothetical protein